MIYMVVIYIIRLLVPCAENVIQNCPCWSFNCWRKYSEPVLDILTKADVWATDSLRGGHVRCLTLQQFHPRGLFYLGSNLGFIIFGYCILIFISGISMCVVASSSYLYKKKTRWFTHSQFTFMQLKCSHPISSDSSRNLKTLNQDRPAQLTETILADYSEIRTWPEIPATLYKAVPSFKEAAAVVLSPDRQNPFHLW